jgi:signal transduction histidine kinase
VRRLLVTSTTLIALAGVLVLGIPLGIVVTALVHENASAVLEREADVAGAALEEDLEAGRPIAPGRLDALARRGHELVVVDASGRRVAGGRRLHGEVIEATVTTAAGGRVTARRPAEEAGEKVGATWLLIGLLSAGGLAAAVVMALLQARRLAGPLEQLAVASDRLGRGDFAAPPVRHGVPEVDAVGEALERSGRRIGELVARERDFTANVTHQLRTPLTALRLRLEELEGLDDAAAMRPEASAALGQVDRLERTVDGLLALARRGAAGDLEPVDLADVARHLAATWGPLFAAEHRVLAVAGAAGPVVGVAERATVEQALEVLLDNALRHGGRRARLAVGRRGPAAVATVEDDGPGIAADVEERLFSRRVSGGGGTGIGLALARDLVEAAGGRLVLAQARPARFELLLPAERPAGRG